ncbi:uncharacterized protein LOC116415685 [Nasonia vitripennis]|uniref:Uncharacterized protein n=1 Tax=Nasonia vitripennis TaxID=7425 RepID=A0A7M7ITH7_NASVI|nr:uncharacterized protein LOC116415685 [Nasonia vitripennis]
MFNEIIDLFETKLKVDEKILIRNASVVPEKKFTKGNVPFEINLQTFSTITSFGEFKWRDSPILHIKFDEIPTKKGRVRLTGYIYNEFVLHNQNNSNEYFGSITNKKNKLDILLLKSKDEELNFKLGVEIEVVGDLQENGNSFLLKVHNKNQIKIINDVPLDLIDLLNGSEIFINEDINNQDIPKN